MASRALRKKRRRDAWKEGMKAKVAAAFGYAPGPPGKAPKAKPKRYEVGRKLAPRKVRRAAYFAKHKTHRAFDMRGQCRAPWWRDDSARMQVEYRKVQVG